MGQAASDGSRHAASRSIESGTDRGILAGIENVAFRAESRADRRRLCEEVLSRHRYAQSGRAQKGRLQRFLQELSGPVGRRRRICAGSSGAPGRRPWTKPGGNCPGRPGAPSCAAGAGSTGGASARSDGAVGPRVRLARLRAGPRPGHPRDPRGAGQVRGRCAAPLERSALPLRGLIENVQAAVVELPRPLPVRVLRRPIVFAAAG